jgi:hypothetical protein
MADIGMEILVKNMSVSGLIVVLGAILATAPPGAADPISFSFNLNGFYLGIPDPSGGPGAYQFVPQPFSGAIAPFGQGQASWLFSLSNSTTLTYTLANGMTITASASASLGGTNSSQSVTGTITGGTGIFQGASGTFTGTINLSPASRAAFRPHSLARAHHGAGCAGRSGRAAFGVDVQHPAKLEFSSGADPDAE